MEVVCCKLQRVEDALDEANQITKTLERKVWGLQQPRVIWPLPRASRLQSPSPMRTEKDDTPVPTSVTLVPTSVIPSSEVSQATSLQKEMTEPGP